MPDKSKKENKYLHGKAFNFTHMHLLLHVQEPGKMERDTCGRGGWIPYQSASLHTNDYLDNFVCIINILYSFVPWLLGGVFFRIWKFLLQ